MQNFLSNEEITALIFVGLLGTIFGAIFTIVMAWEHNAPAALAGLFATVLSLWILSLGRRGGRS